jgi:hypothetical protein
MINEELSKVEMAELLGEQLYIGRLNLFQEEK